MIEFATGSGQVFATPQTITLETTLNLTSTYPISIEGPSWGVTLVGDYSRSRFPIISVAANTGVSIQGISIGTQNPGANGDLQVAGVLDVLQSVTNLGSALSLTGAGTVNLGSQTVTTDSFSLIDCSLINGTLSSSGGFHAIFGAITANVTGAGQFVEDGGGIVILSGINTYTGGTAVTSGKLVVTTASALPNGSNLIVGATRPLLLAA